MSGLSGVVRSLRKPSSVLGDALSHMGAGPAQFDDARGSYLLGVTFLLSDLGGGISGVQQLAVF